MTPLAFVLIVGAFFLGLAFGWIGRAPQVRRLRHERDSRPPADWDRIVRGHLEAHMAHLGGHEALIREHVRNEIDSGEGYGRGRDDA